MALDNAHDIAMYIVKVILMILGLWKLIELLKDKK